MVCAVTAVLASVALPAYQHTTLRAARSDAVDALTRVQAAQEMFRAQHGRYTEDITALRGAAPISPQGRYTVELALAGPEAFSATARARGEQRRDDECAALTLSVVQGFPSIGPLPRCWNR